MIKPAEKTYGVLLPIPDAAEVLGIAPRTLREWIQQGLIESHKLFGGVRRVSEDEILRIIEDSREGPARGEKRPRVESVEATTRGRRSR